MVAWKLVWLVGLCLVLIVDAAAGEAGGKFFKVFPVGVVGKKDGKTVLRIDERYAKALKGLDGFSHVAVLYWFDRNDTPAKRAILQVHPRGNRNNPLTGVFACRAPVRPNLIALSVCRVRSVEGNVVHVDGIDAFDQTPILDLKPHIPSIDCPKKGVVLPGWLGKR
jgi:tRNA-Thr(GGU) m(6)t(6)A37 methyltransferase TsaA